MTYDSLIKRIEKIRPAELTERNHVVAQIVELGIRWSLATIGSCLETRNTLQTLRAVEHAYQQNPSSANNASQTAMMLSLVDIEQGSVVEKILQEAVQRLEDGVIKMHELGAVGKANEYAKIYRTLSEYIQIS